MRKSSMLLLWLMLFSALAFAQAQTVSGIIRDNNGIAIPYATVSETGKNNNSVMADANGAFSIKVDPNATLTVTATGHRAQVLKVNGNSLNFTLEKGEGPMQEVVVTALGIRRNRNTLPYAAQQLNGEEVSQSRSNNFVSALSGRVSGVEIRQGNGMGSSTNVVIRGAKSLLNSNQALFVVDGVPVDNSNTTNAATATGRVNDVNNRAVGGYDYGNAASDINPDDIESVTVLKGAAATALYGSRAANGVIMVTTKKSRKGLGITVNSGFTVGNIDKNTFPEYQREYGAGYQQGGYSTGTAT